MNEQEEIEFNNLKKFLEDYSKEIGISTAITSELITDKFVRDLLQASKSYNWEQLRNCFSISGISKQSDLIALRDLARGLAKALKIGGPATALLSSIYSDWNNRGLPEETAKAVATIGIGALLGVIFSPIVAGSAIAIVSAAIVGYYMDDIWNGMVDGFADIWGKVFNAFPNLVLNNGIIARLSSLITTTENVRSPLVIDLDGDGIETTSVGNGVYFDHDGNGFAEDTGWAGKDDGLLVRDLNGNGEIEDGTELFGNNSVLASGQKAANGFEALKDLDSNHDGKFSNLDAAWNEVKVWKDANGNGLVEEGELLSLEQANVSEINLNYNSQETVDANGNAHAQNSTITKTDGTSGNISDIWFDVDLANTADRTEVEIPEAIKGLPNVEGFGNVHSLQVAMALDASGELKTLVEQFIAETNVVARKAILVNLIYHWTGVQDMDPEGRNPTQIYGNVLGDSRKLEALEEFIGKEYLGTWCWGERDPNPHGHAAPYILDAFEKLCDYVGLEILSQSQYQPLLENVALTWNAETQNWDIDVSGAVTILQNAYDLDAENGTAIMKEFARLVQNVGLEMNAEIINAFQAAGILGSDDFSNLLADFGKATGTNGDDIIYGTNVNDNISGLDGNDRIVGGGGICYANEIAA